MEELEFRKLLLQYTDSPEWKLTDRWFEAAYYVGTALKIKQFEEFSVTLKGLLENHSKEVTEIVYQNPSMLSIEIEPYAKFIQAGGSIEEAIQYVYDGVFLVQGMTGTESYETPTFQLDHEDGNVSGLISESKMKKYGMICKCFRADANTHSIGKTQSYRNKPK